MTGIHNSGVIGRGRLGLGVLMFLIWTNERGLADEATAASTSPNFTDHIKPILRQHCLKCHGDDTQEADLNLQQYGALLRGGSGGKIIEVGRSSQSRLLQIITDPDDGARMPPNSPPLEKEKVDLIRTWIDGGLRETASSTSLVNSRELGFAPSAAAMAKPTGPAAMPLPESPSLMIPPNRFPVLSLSTSPWAPVAASSAWEMILLTHIGTQQTVRALPFPEGEPHVLRFSRDGSLLLAAGGRPVESGRVVLFDVRSGRRLAELADELDTILAADLSPDQRRVAMGGSSRVVKVLSTENGKEQHRLTRHTEWITAVAFSPDGTRLATGDRSGAIHLWDAETGGIQLNLAEHQGAITSLTWRDDGKLLASSGDDGRLIWWDTTDGFPAINKPDAHPPQRPAGTFGTIPNGILAASFDHEGRLVSCGRDRNVRLWSVDGTEVVSWPTEELPLSCAITFDGQQVVFGDGRGRLHFLKPTGR